MLHVVQHLLSEQVSLVPALVIFDKGGPLLDFRASSEAGLTALGVRSFVDALVCVDDGWPPKPAPDMVWAACRTVGVAPLQAVVVGDSATDLQMGCSAGAGLVVGVLSGVSPAELLAPHADVLLQSVADLV